MPKAVRFDEYGDVDVLEVATSTRPMPGAGEVLVEVGAAAINPGEASIRRGLLQDLWPATFPSGAGQRPRRRRDRGRPGRRGPRRRETR